MRKIIFITVLSFVSIIGLCVLSNRFVKPLPLSINALSLRWTVAPGSFFVPDPDYKGPGVMMQTNLELSAVIKMILRIESSLFISQPRNFPNDKHPYRF